MQDLEGFTNAVSVPNSHGWLFDTFDLAWSRLVMTLGDDPTAIDAARRKLARVMLRLSESGMDAGQIAAAALLELGLRQPSIHPGLRGQAIELMPEPSGR